MLFFFYILHEPYIILPLGFTIMILSWVYGLWVFFFKPYKKYPVLNTSYFTSMADAILIIFWVKATGGFHSPFYALFYISVITIAFRYSYKTTLFVTLMYIGIYVLFVSNDIHVNYFEMTVRMTFLLLIGIASGLLSIDTMERIHDKIVMQKAVQSASLSEMKLRKLLKRLQEHIAQRRIFEVELQKAQTELEQKVASRTSDLKRSNELLKQEIAERNRAEDMLNYKIRELDTFIYRSTHDIRGPLSSLLGLINISRRETEEDSMLKNFEMMEKSVKRLDNILLDLLNVSLIKHGKVKPESICMKEMIEEVVSSVKGVNIHPSDFTFISSISSDKIFHSDKVLLTTVLQNLIENAYKYRDLKKEKRYVEITLNQSKDEIKLSIKDNGIGIPDKLKDQVFDMFFRGSLQSPGTGLGLYIVKNAVEKLGGTIDMKSKEGETTAFYLILPDLLTRGEEYTQI